MVDPGDSEDSPGRRSDRAAAERHERIAVAAYYNAERRDFRPGGELGDWVQAEWQVNGAQLSRTAREEITGRDRRSPVDAGLPGEADEQRTARKKTGSRL